MAQAQEAQRAAAKGPTSAGSDDAMWAHVEPESSRRLLLAALDAFAAHGFARATTRQIAEIAGMSPAAVYLHYRSKIDLLLEITRVGHASVLDEVSRAIENVDDPAEALRLFVEAFAAWHARHHTLARIAQYEVAALPEDRTADIGAMRQRFRDIVASLLLEGERRGQFAVIDARSTGRAILSLGIDVSRWYRPGGDLTPADVGRLYGELVGRMVRPSLPTS
jgi:AcrR family transcriptional regulator